MNLIRRTRTTGARIWVFEEKFIHFIYSSHFSSIFWKHIILHQFQTKVNKMNISIVFIFPIFFIIAAKGIPIGSNIRLISFPTEIQNIPTVSQNANSEINWEEVGQIITNLTHLCEILTGNSLSKRCIMVFPIHYCLFRYMLCLRWK